MALTLGTNCGFVLTAPSADPAGANTGFDNGAWATKHVAPQGATRIVEVGWYCDNATEAADWEGGLYSDAAAGEPEARLQVSATQAKGTGSGWKTATGLVWTGVIPGTTYWVAVQLDNTATTTNGNSDTANGSGYAAVAGAALPADWGTSVATDADGMVGIYAVYRTSRLIKRRHRA